jgi:hypothetical protein
MLWLRLLLMPLVLLPLLFLPPLWASPQRPRAEVVVRGGAAKRVRASEICYGGV